MSLDTSMEHQIKFSADIEHKSLYNWCLREFSDDDKQLDRDWIPWSWSLGFRTQKVTYHLSFSDGDGLSFTNDKDDEDQKRDTKNIQLDAKEWIAADLVPEGVDTIAPRYFMMGSSRVVEDISLLIYKSDTNAHCSCVSIPEYEGGFDFHEKTIPDHLSFMVSLDTKKFDQIKQLIKADSLGSLSFYIKRVAGFYSDWSPDIVTDKIKILSSLGDQKFEIPNEMKDSVRRTGIVGEFSLTISSHERHIEIEKNIDDEIIDDYENEEKLFSPIDQNLDEILSFCKREITELKAALKVFKFPLWIIVTLLAGILFL